MKKDMDKFRASNKFVAVEKQLKLLICVTGIMLIMHSYSAFAQVRENISIEETVGNFLEIWLIKHEIDTALTFISDKPVFPKCWADKGESLDWRKNKAGVVRMLEPVFKRISEDVGKIKTLEEVIENHQEKFSYGTLINHKYSSQFDLYTVDKKLRDRIIHDTCDYKNDNNFLVRGIKKQRELYLVYFYFKKGVLVKMVWTREKGTFRLFYMDFP